MSPAFGRHRPLALVVDDSRASAVRCAGSSQVSVSMFSRLNTVAMP